MERSKIGTQILIGICGLCVGFGSSQLALSREVHINTANMAAVERMVKDDKDTTNGRIANLTASIDKLISQNTELIAIIKIQYKQP